MAENILQEVTQSEYKYGFTTDIETDIIPVGLNEDVVRLISTKKHEPEWLLEYRLKAYHKWTTMVMPDWAHLNIPELIIKAFRITRLRKRIRLKVWMRWILSF